MKETEKWSTQRYATQYATVRYRTVRPRPRPQPRFSARSVRHGASKNEGPTFNGWCEGRCEWRLGYAWFWAVALPALKV